MEVEHRRREKDVCARLRRLGEVLHRARAAGRDHRGVRNLADLFDEREVVARANAVRGLGSRP